MKHIFIINPAAGKGNRLYELKARIHAACRKKGVSYIIYQTGHVGDAKSFAAEQASTGSPIRLYACGGDGTLNEVVSGAYGHENAEVGLIPMGTGNDFHRNFRHGDMFFDIEGQLEGCVRRFDLMHCNEHICVNMLNIGFDCEVAHATEHIKCHALVPAKLAYITGLAECFCGKIGTRFTVKLDNGEVFRQPMTLFTAANGGFCGGGFFAAPRASLSDGKMDLCMIGRISHVGLLRAVASYRKGTHFEKKELQSILKYRRVKSADIIFQKKHLLCIDGETMYARQLHIEMERKALPFVCPRGTRPLQANEAHRSI